MQRTRPRIIPALALVALLCVLPLQALAQSTATASSPARMSVDIPAAVKSASVTMLDLAVRPQRKGTSGNLGGVVRLQRPGGGGPVEIGRFSLSGEGEQHYQFNVADALRRLDVAGSAEIEVALIERSGGGVPSGAALSIGPARIVTR